MQGDQRAFRSASGFTLIELLVVIALITLISIIAIPSISSYFQISLSSATREIASTVKEAYNSTLVTGKVRRVAYDLKEGKYWVEVGPASMLLHTRESREKEERRKRFSDPDEKKEKSEFVLDKTVTRKKMSLPRGVRFEDVTTEQFKEPVTEGIVYSHIFPNGMTEQTLIHLADDSKHRTSLVLTPLLGRTDVYERYVPEEEVFGK